MRVEVTMHLFRCPGCKSARSVPGLCIYCRPVAPPGRTRTKKGRKLTAERDAMRAVVEAAKDHAFHEHTEDCNEVLFCRQKSREAFAVALAALAVKP